MRYEWKKNEKKIYLPKTEPSLVEIPMFNYLVIDGKGNPNTSMEFTKNIETLYSLSYAIKMLPKNGVTPDNYYEYSVFPLEGIWDMDDTSNDFSKLDKDRFIYSIMIRQPDFVNKDLVLEIVEKLKRKKPHLNFNNVRFGQFQDGLCVQMMHLGSYDDEPISFAKMEQFCKDNGLVRIKHSHREIYISDHRKTPKDKLMTVLRINVEYKK